MCAMVPSPPYRPRTPGGISRSAPHRLNRYMRVGRGWAAASGGGWRAKKEVRVYDGCMRFQEFRSWLRRPQREPLIMGVLNVTPDSFSDGGTHPE